eukprot:scaffold177121_cov50-Cyclotella_meneghiniana.AAC.1
MLASSGIFSDEEKAEGQDSLVAHANRMTKLGHTVKIVEKANEYLLYAQSATCSSIPANICAAIAGCIPNVVKFVCGTIYQMTLHVVYAVQQALEISLYVMEAEFGRRSL